MDYGWHYDQLVDRARGRILKGYSERHHVLPRCLGGGDEPENLVRLTAEEHYVAHQLLIRIHPAERRLVWAAHLMATRPGNKLYGWLRRAMSEARRGTKQSPEHIAKLAAVRKGRKASDETKAKLAAKSLGRPKSPETIALMKEVSRRRGISPETRAKMNAANEVRHAAARERTAAVKAASREARLAAREEVRAARAEAKANRKRAPHSPETRAKMSAAAKGRKKTPEHCAAISASKLGVKRTPHSEATKRKMAESQKRASKTRDQSYMQDPEYRAQQAAKMRVIWAERRAAKLKG